MADTVADLVARLRHPKKTVRERALVELTNAKPDPELVLPALREILANPAEDRSLRSRAGGIIWGLGPAGLPTLLEFARTGDVSVRCECMQRLEFAFPESTEKHAILWTMIDGLGDASEYIRSRAVSSLKAIGSVAIELLQRAVDSDGAAGTYAAVALLEIDNNQPRAVERLVADLGDADPLLRRVAAQGLQKASGESVSLAWQPLLDRLADSDVEVRRAAAMALSDLPPAPAELALPVLVRALRELPGEYVDWHLRACVGYVLRSYGPDAAPAVPAIVETLTEVLEDFDYLDGPEGYICGSLTRALGDIGPAAAAALPGLRTLGKLARQREDEDLAEEVRDAMRQIRRGSR
jgi:HEAT repeat protein